MNVHIYEAWANHKAFHVEPLGIRRRLGRRVFAHGSDLPIGNQHICESVKAVSWVYHSSASEKKRAHAQRGYTLQPGVQAPASWPAMGAAWKRDCSLWRNSEIPAALDPGPRQRSSAAD